MRNKLLFTIKLIFIIFCTYFSNTYSISIAQTSLSFSPTSDFGPRTVGYYDWHNGIDFGSNNQNKIVYAIEKGTINLMGGSLNVIAIGDWEYLHCYRNEDQPNNPVPKSAVGSDYKVYCGSVRLNYEDAGIVKNKNVNCLMVWKGNELHNIYCNSSTGKGCYYIDGDKNISVSHEVPEGAPFAITSGYGSSGNDHYDIHLHLQLTGYKNPYLKYSHPAPSYDIIINEPISNEEITSNKPETENKVCVTIDSSTGLDLNKVALFLFSTLKENPTGSDLINEHNHNEKGLFYYAGEIGNPRNNCYPSSLYYKVVDPKKADQVKEANSRIGSFTNTGVKPLGSGRDEFYYTYLKTKITNNGSNCDDVLQAKYPDGEYYFFVRAYSILGKTFDQKQQVLLNNWTPQIKSFTTNSPPDKPLKAGDTIEIKIEFTEQMDTGKKPKVEIWDAKASQWKSLSLSATAWSNSSDGRIKDALLKASATLPDWGETGEGTTQELKVKVTEACKELKYQSVLLLCLKVRLISDL